MGCTHSSKDVVEPASKSARAEAKPSSDATSSTGPVTPGTVATPGDDMAWAAGPAPTTVSLDSRVSQLSESIRSLITRGVARVQIELDGGWKDVMPDDHKIMCEHLAAGETTFSMSARGQTYTVDFSNMAAASQTNQATGKKRKLRLMDSEGAEDAQVPLASTTSKAVTPRPIPEEMAKQQEYGPQSKRGGASQAPYRVLNEEPHAQACFAQLEQNEAKLCGEWAVFYHSYSFAALLYEVHAAVGSVLFRFRSQYAALPRILVHEFNDIPDAPTLAKKFNDEFKDNKRDHHPEYRKVGISVMCSLAATGPEACTAMVFIQGYSCKDLSFRGVLERLLESCYVPKAKVQNLADAIIKTSEKHGLDVTQFGGKPCKSGKAGHLMQIFIKRHLVDKLVYAAKPYGPIDEERMPVSTWMNSNSSFSVGQARIVAHPKYFMQANQTRMFVASADPTFHANRQAFQEELIGLLKLILGQPALRTKAAQGIYGGTLPSWWSDEDQRQHA